MKSKESRKQAVEKIALYLWSIVNSDRNLNLEEAKATWEFEDKPCIEDATEILSLIEQSGLYMPVPQGEEGLLSISEIGDICNLDCPKNSTDYDEQFSKLDSCFKVAQSQNALTERGCEAKYKAEIEGIRKVIKGYDKGDGWIEIPEDDLDDVLNKTLEGSK